MKFILLTFFLLSISALTFGQQSGKFNGVLFGDYFYKFDGDSSGSAGQYSPYNKSTQGFMIRRTRLHYEQPFNENFFGNIGVESNDVSKLDGKVSFILYDANFEWKNLVPNSSIIFGLMPTPTFVWGMSEKMWGFRSVEKTIADKNGIGTSVDIGIMLKGNFVKDGKYGYTLLIGNGKGLKPEVSKYLKFYGYVFAKFYENFVTEIYGDYQAGANEQYRYTVKSVIGYKDKHNSLTFEPLFQFRNNFYGIDKPQNPFAFSVNGKINISRKTDAEETEKVNLFARYDFFNPNSNVGNAGYNEHFINAGIDILPFKNFHIIPNIWATIYSDKSPAKISRSTDLVGRMTFWFVY